MFKRIADPHRHRRRRTRSRRRSRRVRRPRSRPVKPLQVKWILGPGQTTAEYPTMYGYETVELDDPSYPGPRLP